VIWVASGVFAALAPGHPTGLVVLDLVLKAALGLGVSFLASFASWRWLAAGALAGVIGSFQEATLWPAMAALGGALTSSGRLSAGRSGDGSAMPTLVSSADVRSAVGAVVCEVALRLSWPHAALVPSALAAFAMLMVVTGGLVSAPEEVRRGARRTAVVLGAVVGAMTLLALGSILVARSSLEHALSDTQAGLKAAESGQSREAARGFSAALAAYDSAGSDLAVARLAEIVPVVSQQVRAVGLATSIGHRLAEAGRQTAQGANPATLQMSHGVFPIGALERLGPVFASDVVAVHGCLAESGPFGSPWIVAPLRSRLTSLTAKLHKAALDAANAVLTVRVAPGLLGADGERRYLLLFENPAESRASGGVIGDFAVVTADHGKLSLVRTGSVAQLNSAGSADRRLIGPPEYVARYSRFEPQYSWENVPMSPDFPSVAEVAANLFPQSGGGHVDGVISVDPVALAGLIRATGPVTAPGWSLQVKPGDAVQVMANSEFVHFGKDNAARVAWIQSLIKNIWHALVSKPLPPMPVLGHDISAAVGGGHLHLWSRSASAEALFRATHVAGGLPPVHGDFLGVVTQNAAGNKIDWYLRRRIDYHVTLNELTRQADATLEVTLDNHAPKSGLPPIVISPAPGAPVTPGEAQLYVSIYSPWLLTGSSVNGKAMSMSDQRELGRYVYSGLVTVPAGGTTTLQLHLVGQMGPGNPPLKVTQYQQPLLFPDSVHIGVSTIGG
jgi:hypothetical protein